ncbi:Ger(x)C family spore germination protein [Paenibacillus sp. KQZ6P-2]|uniref:Ger(X)C family spore germination protein n=1 Tax=Paenibacillus mangrovi TaxID=2931978 RepID=A0A9X2B2I9_9BACL|nr:Ger(x)C family spore germination protein [Paenibacillus mangrovi]MCJ8012000.1 Ger(x)C family spore germination protein [Paenibacillus mangrovi]
MMKKIIRCILAVILLSTLLTGCWGAREIEHMVYVNTLGVDYVKDKVVIYIQMVNFSGIAKRESGQITQKTAIGKAEGDSFDTAIFNLYTSSPQRVVWSHIKTIVFSEAALRSDVIRQVLDEWDRYYEFRYTIWMMATKEPMEDVLNTLSISDLSVIYSQLNSPLREYEQNSIIAPMYMYKFIWKWKEKGATLLLPYIDIRSGWTEERKPNPNISVSGVCFLDNQKFQSCLKSKDILGLRWLEKKTKRTPLMIREDNKVKAVMVMTKIKSSIKPKLKHGKPVFDIKVSMQATTTELSTSFNKKKLELQAANEIEKQLMKTYLKGLEEDIDVYELSRVFYRSKPKEWHKLSAKGKLPLDPSSIEKIDIKVNLNSGGIAKMR